VTSITGCRNCHVPAARLTEVLDLGMQRLSDFRDTPEPTEAWPLRLVCCPECRLAQLDTTVPRELLYHDGYGFYSGVNEANRADLAGVVGDALHHVPDPRSWVDIASNDGTLLSNVPRETLRIGIDPVPKFAAMTAARDIDEALTGYFPDPDILAALPDQVNVITAVSVFYDLDDPHAFLAACADLLDDKGVLVVQQNYLPAMLHHGAYDNVSHEHLTYWALEPFADALAQHGLDAIDVRFSPTNGGVFRVVAGHRGVRLPAPGIVTRRAVERHTLRGRLTAFGARTARLIQDLAELVAQIVAEGARVMVYGASTRGAVIWQAAGLGPAVLDAAVERNPEKVGRWYSAIGIPIISEEQMRADPPDYLLCGPWWLKAGILEREHAYRQAGGRFIFPLPEVEVV
jgi:NDP-4-keto-2,6-dideoxyhexose 3-C-methyltransferase